VGRTLREWYATPRDVGYRIGAEHAGRVHERVLLCYDAVQRMFGIRSSHFRRTGIACEPHRRFFLSSFAYRLAAAAIACSLFIVPSASADHQQCGAPAPEALVTSLLRQARGLRPEVLTLALNASRCAAERGLVRRSDLLTVIDYSIASTEPRLWVFDLDARKLLFRELVAHGKNSGDNFATHFSNVEGSLATSLGLFVTADPYVGSNGYSLRLRGLERGVNDNAWSRAIVMHGAPYVSESSIAALGRLGRSWGCPAVRHSVARKMIDTIRGGSPIFAYYPDRRWLAGSSFLPPGPAVRRVSGPAAAPRCAKKI
jgi:hypothetical protein